MYVSPLNPKELAKINAAKKAIENIFDGMVVGVGTGTTVNYLISLIGKLNTQDTLDLVFVPSSKETHLQLIKQGLHVSTLEEYAEIDVYIDGADAILKDLSLIKGKGGALTMEKILAHAAQEFIVIADNSKYPSELLDVPVPIEFIPSAINTLFKPIFSLGGELKVRYGTGKIGPIFTEHGNMLGDIHFSREYSIKDMEIELNRIPGIIENGLFYNVAHKIIIGFPDGRIEILGH
ncbi:MAG: ribose 5-phosphate isomerase A [Candidatus Heimdallarchaeaceae archaeon]